MPAPRVDRGNFHVATSLGSQRRDPISPAMRISSALSVSSTCALLCTNRYDGQTCLFAPLLHGPSLAGLIFQRRLGRRRLAAPGSSDSPLIDQWSISIAVCRHPSDSCSLRTVTSGPFLDLPPPCSFEHAHICEGVGRYREVVVVERMMPDFFHVVPIRDDTVLNGILQRQNATLALRLVTDITILLVHTDNDAWHLGPADNRTEYSARCIVTSETSLASSAMFAGMNGQKV